MVSTQLRRWTESADLLNDAMEYMTMESSYMARATVVHAVGLIGPAVNSVRWFSLTVAWFSGPELVSYLDTRRIASRLNLLRSSTTLPTTYTLQRGGGGGHGVCERVPPREARGEARSEAR